MDLGLKNAEGYYDLTAYEAIKRKRMPSDEYVL